MHGQPTPRPLLRGQATLRVGIVTDIVGLANLNPFGRQGDEQQVGIISRRCMAADIRADLRHQRQRLGRRLGVHDHDDAVDRGRPPIALRLQKLLGIGDLRLHTRDEGLRHARCGLRTVIATGVLGHGIVNHLIRNRWTAPGAYRVTSQGGFFRRRINLP